MRSASMQVQLRDLAGFVDTRATILQLKPGTKSHWISFAIAHHLNGSHDIAAEALKKYEGLQVHDFADPPHYEGMMSTSLLSML